MRGSALSAGALEVGRLVESAHCLRVVLEVPRSHRELPDVLVAWLVGGEFVGYGLRAIWRAVRMRGLLVRRALT